jgi:hypothetical protein
MVWIFLLTLVVQAVRVLGDLDGRKAVGVDLSPRPYYVMGPLLFLVLLVPFTSTGSRCARRSSSASSASSASRRRRRSRRAFSSSSVTVGLALPGRSSWRSKACARQRLR